MSKYIKDTALTLATQLLSGALAFAVGIIIARTLGPSGKGIVSLLAYFALIISLLLSFGVNTANAFFTGSDNTRVGEIAGNTLFFCAIMGGAGVILLLIGQELILHRFLKNVPPQFLTIALISTPFLLLTRNLITIPQGLNKFKEFNFLNLITPVSRLIFIFLFLVILRKETVGGVWAYTFSAILVAAVCVITIPRMGRPSLSMNFRLLKNTLRYGGKGYLGVLSELLNFRLDLFIVNYFLTSEAVGFYAAALAIAELVRYFPRAVGKTLFPRVTSSEGEKKEQVTRIIFRSVLVLSVLLGICICIAAGQIIVRIYGFSFAPSIPLLQIVVFGVVASGASSLLVVYFCAKGKPEYFTYGSLISLGSVVILDLALIPKVGLLGAAVALALSHIIVGVICVYWFHRESSSTLKEILFVTREDVALYRRALSYRGAE